jgi:hypothetical protein
MVDIIKHFAEINENNYMNNNKTDLDIKNEELKQIFMCDTDNAYNPTESYTNNDKISKNNQIEEVIFNVKIIESKKKENNEEIKSNKKPKRGRHPKNVPKNNDNDTKRNKYAKDNIARKIKTNFFNFFIVNLLNIIIKRVYGKQIYLVRKFNQQLVTDVSIEFNLDLYNSKIRNLLNQEISNKYKKIELDNNKKILNCLEKNLEFNKILNITVNEIYSLFINDNYKEIISNIFNIDKKEIYFENVTGKIIELKEKGEEEKYIENFKDFAYNIYLVFDKSKKRKQRKKYKKNIISNDN